MAEYYLAFRISETHSPLIHSPLTYSPLHKFSHIHKRGYPYLRFMLFNVIQQLPVSFLRNIDRMVTSHPMKNNYQQGLVIYCFFHGGNQFLTRLAIGPDKFNFEWFERIHSKSVGRTITGSNKIFF